MATTAAGIADPRLTTDGTDSYVRVALLNLRGGALVAPGRYELARLERIMSQLSGPPAYVGLCEAKLWRDNGHAGLLDAATTLSAVFNRPYVGHLCPSDRGPNGPAMFYDPTVLRLVRWHDGTSHPDFPDARGRAELEVRATGARAVFFLEHWHPSSPQLRLERARLLDRYGAAYPLPVVILGDLNCTPPGELYPGRDWAQASPRLRSHKAIQRPDGTWAAASAPIAHLQTVGFTAVPDLAYATGTPAELAYAPTVTDDDAGAETIDVILLNRAGTFVSGSHHVYRAISVGGRADSDHDLVTTTLDLAN